MMARAYLSILELGNRGRDESIGVIGVDGSHLRSVELRDELGDVTTEKRFTECLEL